MDFRTCTFVDRYVDFELLLLGKITEIHYICRLVSGSAGDSF